jgi:hypothetical protein
MGGAGPPVFRRHLAARRGVCGFGQQQFNCAPGILVHAKQRLADDIIRKLRENHLDLLNQLGQVPRRGHRG